MTTAHRRTRTRLTAAITAITILGAMSCTRARTGDESSTPPTTGVYINDVVSTETPVVGGVLVYGIPAETNSWNPSLAQWGSYSMQVARSMFDFLTAFDADGAAKPYLAEAVTPTDDYMAWTIKLQPNLRFTNGKPVTSETIRRILEHIKGSPVVGESSQFIDSFQIIDDLNLNVRMKRRFAVFREYLASQIGAIGDPDWLTTNDGVNPVGTGPFQLERWDIGNEIVVKKNAGYWRKDTNGTQYPYLDGVTFRVITDSNERLAALQAGDLDVMMQAQASPAVVSLRAAADQGEIQLFSDRTAESSEDFLILNNSKPPFNDRDARAAMAHATDLNAFVEDMTNGQGVPASSAFAPWSKWHTDVPYPRFDLERARALVEQVKARNNGEFAFELMITPDPDASRVAQYLKTMWERAGITVTPVTQNRQAKIIKTVTGEFQATFFQLLDSTIPAVDAVFWGFEKSTNPTFSLNFGRFDDAATREAGQGFMASDNDAERKAQMATIMNRMATEVPFIWLTHNTRYVAARSQVVNLVRAYLPDGRLAADFVSGSHTLHQVWVKR